MTNDTNLPEINLRKRKTPSAVLADVELVFEGAHKIKGFKLIASKHNDSGYAVLAPKAPKPNGQGDMWFYFCEDRGVWGNLEEKIIKKYLSLEFGHQTVS